MSADKPIHRLAIIGTGVIGASWAALFLVHGLEVIATDPAPNAEDNLRESIENAWPALEQLGLSSGASRKPTLRNWMNANRPAWRTQTDLLRFQVLHNRCGSHN
jgi:3-hydroxyacyl-CoA dehydrogenase